MADSLKQSLRDGRYAVTRKLGEGSQAATFEAVDKKHGALVAIKRFRVRGATSWKEVELAEREARVLAALSASSSPAMPPSLPRYIEHFEEDGELYLVTELIEGESLLTLRKRGALTTEAEVVRLLRDASVALDFIHRRSPPVVHRDIKPSNVLRRRDGSFAFIDFGSVRDRLKPEGGSTVVGTFGYMAPEQFQGRAMPASDVYSVGATALSMLTGAEPESLPHKGLAIDVQAALAGHNASPAMVAALRAMLEPDPDKRAARIEPLLAAFASIPKVDARAREGGKPGEERRGSGREEKRGRKEGRREEWEARKEERREEKRGRKEGRREEWQARKEAVRAMQHQPWRGRKRGPFIPAPLIPLFLIGLTIGQIAVTLALGVFVPVLFTVLSVVLGKGMREAGRTTRNAGKIAVAAMGRAKHIVVHGVPPEEDDEVIGVRVVDAEGAKAKGPAARVVTEVGRAADAAARAAEEEQAAQEAYEAEEAAREAARARQKERDRRR
jgi:hypothetical protein